MKTLIFSDTHFTTKFNQKQYDLLVKAIKKADRVIINGDFFDGYLSRFEDFINSRWNKLFPLLKTKKTIYINGNHDHNRLVNGEVKLFSTKVVEEYAFKSGKKKFLVTHGHKIYPSIETRFSFITNFINKFNLANLMFKVYARATDFSIQLLGLKYYLFKQKVENAHMKSWAKKNLKPNEYLVVGHTHLQEYDPKNRFICSGLIGYGLFQYLVVSNGTINLFSEQY